jgi:hypothetical protein
MIDENAPKIFRDLDEKLMQNLLLENEYDNLETNFPNLRSKERVAG